jgi:hypothetical protein
MQHSPTRTPEPCATLTIEEAREFEMLDALPPFDDCGNWAIWPRHVGPPGTGSYSCFR